MWCRPRHSALVREKKGVAVGATVHHSRATHPLSGHHCRLFMVKGQHRRFLVLSDRVNQRGDGAARDEEEGVDSKRKARLDYDLRRTHRNY